MPIIPNLSETDRLKRVQARVNYADYIVQQQALEQKIKNNVYGGPLSKIEHLENIKLSHNSIFFGDSAYDFNIAQKFNIDFGLIYGQTDQIFTHNSDLIKIIAPNFKNIKIK